MTDTSLLHDHLDGGMRPGTVFDLANSQGVPLPNGVTSAAELGNWLRIHPGMDLGDAFGRFDLPIAVLQNPSDVERAASEAVEDLRADDVSSAELRFAPLQHTSVATADEIIEAALSGLATGGAGWKLILCAMRTEYRTDEVVDLAIRWCKQGVVGVDLAGPEAGFPVDPHAAAFRRAKENGLGVTIHAGEMDSYQNVESAIRLADADRIGHGWRLIDDCTVADGNIESIGPTAQMVLDRAIPLEMCVSSNECLGVTPADHPILKMHRAGFNVSVNTDNRTLTAGPLSGEYALIASLGATAEETNEMKLNAALARFS